MGSVSNMTFDEYLLSWSRLHSQAKASAIVRMWLRAAFWCSSPFIRFGPNAVTFFGALVMLLTIPLAHTRPICAAVAMPLIGLIDNIDGIVAVRSQRVSRYGAFLDSVVDRLVDIACVGLIISFGAPITLAILAVMTTLLLEYIRARASSLGATDVGVISIAEKPTRVILTFMTLLCIALFPFDQEVVSTISIITWSTVGMIGIFQVWPAMRRQLQAQ